MTKKLPHDDWEKLFGIKKEEREDKEFELFLKEVENIKVAKKVSEGESRVIPEKIKLPKKKVLKIDDEIDLHGLTKVETEDALVGFFENAVREKYSVVLVIPGKGKHSEKGGMLKVFVEKWFKKEGARFISKYSVAPKAHGGEGAFVVYLKKG